MKKRLLCPELPTRGSPSLLAETEAHHAIRVLRLRDGETVEAINGKGLQTAATLRIRGGQPRLEFLEPSDALHEIDASPLPLILEMAVLKGDAMEWVVEKSVELGVAKFVPVLTDFTVVQMKSKGPSLFQERWQKIADQALKQCGRLHRMPVEFPLSLESLLTQTAPSPSQSHSPQIRFWCDEASKGEASTLLEGLAQTTKSGEMPMIRVLIGPEGGWSPNERTLLSNESKISPIARIDLGPNILRAETAALFSTSVITAYLESQRRLARTQPSEKLGENPR